MNVHFEPSAGRGADLEGVRGARHSDDSFRAQLHSFRSREGEVLQHGHQEQEQLHPGQGLTHTCTFSWRGQKRSHEHFPPWFLGNPAQRLLLPAEKGKNAFLLTKLPLESRKCPGLNTCGVSHSFLSKSTDVKMVNTVLPCKTQTDDGEAHLSYVPTKLRVH